jgi:hypothetical protein
MRPRQQPTRSAMRRRRLHTLLYVLLLECPATAANRSKGGDEDEDED